jgi:hypothetical protein
MYQAMADYVDTIETCWTPPKIISLGFGGSNSIHLHGRNRHMLYLAGCELDLPLDPEDKRTMFLRNVGEHFKKQQRCSLSKCFLNYQNYITRKMTAAWDMTPCGALRVNRLFGGAFRLHLQGKRISRARNQRKNGWECRQARLLC